MSDEIPNDPTAVASMADTVRGIATLPGLEEREAQTLERAAKALEVLSDIETGERYVESPVTGNEYKVTRWVDLGDGKLLAIDKQEAITNE